MPDLIDIETEQRLSREEAAAVLRQLADSLSRHNELEFMRDSIQVRIDVPDEVTLEIELEVDADGGSLEVEISW